MCLTLLWMGIVPKGLFNQKNTALTFRLRSVARIIKHTISTDMLNYVLGTLFKKPR